MIRFQKVDERAFLPTRGSVGSAGLDLYALEAISIQPFECGIVRTGLAWQPLGNIYGEITMRSSLGKLGLIVAGGKGVIDADFRGEILIPIIFMGNEGEAFTIDSGMRIAQLLVLPLLQPKIELTMWLDSTSRGTGGFGSTGK